MVLLTLASAQILVGLSVGLLSLIMTPMAQRSRTDGGRGTQRESEAPLSPDAHDSPSKCPDWGDMETLGLESLALPEVPSPFQSTSNHLPWGFPITVLGLLCPGLSPVPINLFSFSLTPYRAYFTSLPQPPMLIILNTC